MALVLVQWILLFNVLKQNSYRFFTLIWNSHFILIHIQLGEGTYL